MCTKGGVASLIQENALSYVSSPPRQGRGTEALISGGAVGWTPVGGSPSSRHRPSLVFVGAGAGVHRSGERAAWAGRRQACSRSVEQTKMAPSAALRLLSAVRTWEPSGRWLLVIPLPDVQTIHLRGQGCLFRRRVSGIGSIRCHNGHEVTP